MLVTMRAALTAITLLVSSVAIAQAVSVSTSVQARQARYRETGTAFKAVNDELRKSVPGRFVITSSARQIATNLRQVGALFPPGSGPAPGVRTKAKASIWASRATFDRLNADAIRQADALIAAMRGANTAAIQAQARKLGSTCKACHDRFREGE